MRIAIIGAGYVGLAIGIGFAEFGNEVWFYDIDNKKMDELKRGKIPIYEGGINEYFEKNRQRIHFADKLHDVVRNTDIAFICVGTPTIKGRISLKYVKTAADEIGKVLKDKKTFYGIVIKSTVVPGTAEKIEKLIEKESGKKAGEDFFRHVFGRFKVPGKKAVDHDEFCPGRIGFPPGVFEDRAVFITIAAANAAVEVIFPFLEVFYFKGSVSHLLSAPFIIVLEFVFMPPDISNHWL